MITGTSAVHTSGSLFSFRVRDSFADVWVQSAVAADDIASGPSTLTTSSGRETEPGHALLPGRARQMHVTAAKVGMMLSCTSLLPAVLLAAAATLVVVALFGTDLLLRGVHQPTFLLH